MDNSNIGDVIGQYEENVLTLNDFIIQRSVYMDELFSDEICYIEYNSNGGQGIMSDLENYHLGTTVKLEENIYKKEERKFLGWNTRASGWGKAYEDQEEIYLQADLTLYAQWEKITFLEKTKNFLLGITGN